MSEENVKKLVRVSSVFLGVATLLLVAMLISEVKSYQYIGASVVEEATISVSGEGEIFAKPDTAVFTVQVKEEATTVPEAQDLATEKTNKVIAFLKERGIASDDIKTVAYRISPRYEYRRSESDFSGERVLAGYVVAQALEVKVRDAKTAGEILSGVGELRVANVSGLDFTVDNEEKVKDKARKEAIADAKEKAGELADALGVDLVQVVSFSESSGGGRTPVYYARGVALDEAGVESASPEIPMGENRFVSSVTITYKIR